MKCPYNTGGLGISFGVIMANATSWIIERRQFFPDSGAIPPLRLTMCMSPQWGYQQEWRMESPVRMKALYAASVNGRGQGTEW